MAIRTALRLIARRPQRSLAAAESAAEGTELTFCITDDFPKEILEREGDITIGRSSRRNVWSVMMPPMSKRELQDASLVKSRVVDMISSSGATDKKSFFETARSIASNISKENANSVPYAVAHDVAGYGPFSIILDNSNGLEEIMVNSPTSNICVYHSKYGYCTTNLRFLGEDGFRFMINRMISDTESELNSSSPIIDAHVGDRLRIHAQTRPYSIGGGVASIRLRPKRLVGINDLIKSGTATPEEMAYVWMAMDSGLNIVIAGAPASGKTTMLRAIGAFVPRFDRVITVEEDVSELYGFGNFYNVVQLKSSTLERRVSTGRQVINSLRLRPDRLVVGEVRGSEARDIMFGANIGVPFITTMHSSSAEETITRLKTKPMSVDDALISMLDVVVFMGKAGGARRVDEIAEYRWGKDGDTADVMNEHETHRIFSRSAMLKPELVGSKMISGFAALNILTRKEAALELSKRARFLSEIPEGTESNCADYIERYGELR